MLATFMYGPGDVRVEEAEEPKILAATDAIVRITLSCVCGSDLHAYHGGGTRSGIARMGHEFLGVVEETGADVQTLKKGDLVLAPFVWADNTCEFCREGLHTSCRHGGSWGNGDVGGGQAEAVRVPQADGTLVKLPVPADSELLPDLLTLSDVMCTGYHAAVKGRVSAETTVTVIGDGAVGLSAVLSAKLLGAPRIILMGRHPARTDLGVEFGATDVVAERGEEGVAKVQDLTNGDGTHVVIEAVGFPAAYDQAFGAVRAGGTVSRVGVPQYQDANVGFARMFFRNITLTGGVAPARAYIEQLMPKILDGTIHPGRVFDRTVALPDIAQAYQAMNDREALKVLVRP
ncbi:zinc-binding dehydrogenase [Gryllotalpicola protaetiae]|uniref:IMP dehydrogenase n=1 Tax=Gryllotalpicola protaetiae TaxID=2419771 RepID=A0A387BQV1_9MICO|nr:alcohol dehydrogenase catalytic domain-containing protein [Gryllotalpicola protaetiae]AYG03459.1 IMP dehydrogenase [Gryllotalpicola protaetiae]